jgi:hypothetical protein
MEPLGLSLWAAAIGRVYSCLSSDDLIAFRSLFSASGVIPAKLRPGTGDFCPPMKAPLAANLKSHPPRRLCDSAHPATFGRGTNGFCRSFPFFALRIFPANGLRVIGRRVGSSEETIDSVQTNKDLRLYVV